MSKIQITELNNASEFNTLNAQETADVVGGYGNYINQYLSNYTSQLALGGNGGDGGYAYYGNANGGDGGDASNYNYTNQNQNAQIFDYYYYY